MKILQLSPQIPLPLIDGGKLGIWGITKSICLQGHSVDFLAYSDDVEIEKHEDLIPELCNIIPVYTKLRNSIFQIIKSVFTKIPFNIAKYNTALFKKKLVDQLKKTDYDVFHVDHLHMAWVIDLIREYSSAPIILREHNLEYKIMERFSSEVKNPLLKFFTKLQTNNLIKYEKEFCAKFDTTVMITGMDEKELLSQNNKINTQIIPAGVNDELFSLDRKEIIPNSIVHIGSLEWLPNKSGLDWFLKFIFPDLIKRNSQIRLYLIGKGTMEFELPLRLKDNIIKLGFVDDVWTELPKYSIAIIPLFTGSGMRVKIIELFAAGIPIISTSIGIEGIGAKNNFHYLNADNENEFINCTYKLIDDEKLNMSISANSKEYCYNNFRWEKIGKQFEHCYLEAINKKELLNND